MESGFIDLLFNGLTVSLTGVLVVFSVLALLALAISLIPRIAVLWRFHRVSREARAMVVEEGVSRERVGSVSGDELAVIASAVIGFNEFKKSVLERIELFKKFPQLSRLLPLAGLRFRGSIRVSIGGSERIVYVEEAGGEYIVRFHGRAYRVTLKIPREQAGLKTIDLLKVLES